MNITSYSLCCGAQSSLPMIYAYREYKPFTSALEAYGQSIIDTNVVCNSTKCELLHVPLAVECLLLAIIESSILCCDLQPNREYLTCKIAMHIEWYSIQLISMEKKCCSSMGYLFLVLCEINRISFQGLKNTSFEINGTLCY